MYRTLVNLGKPPLRYLAAIPLVVMGIAPMALAQVTSDATTSTRVTPSGLTFTVDEGRRLGNNLFHSFNEFSIPTGGAVIFNNATDLDTIFSRVTGQNVSNINGLIRANGDANLFLLNPNGIVFNNDAVLDIGGSFLATTAEQLTFADGSVFSTDIGQPTLLTISVPRGLQFSPSSGSIQAAGEGSNITQTTQLSSLTPIVRLPSSSSLEVNTGQSLALLGGDITLDGSTLLAESGQIDLGAVGQGTVAIDVTSSGWDFDYGEVIQFEDINLLNQALIDASQSTISPDSLRSGSINLTGQDIRVENGSAAIIQNIGPLAGGDITVKAAGTLSTVGINARGDVLSGFRNTTLANGPGGNISLQVENLIMENGGVISVGTYGVADGGALFVEVNDTLEIAGFPSVRPDLVSNLITFTLGIGNAGDVYINTQRLQVDRGGALSSVSFRNPTVADIGNSGLLVVRASELVQVSGENSITRVPSNLATVTFSRGNAENVSITTPRILVLDGGRIGTTTLAEGNAGDVVLFANQDIEVIGIGESQFNPSLIAASADILDPLTRFVFNVPDRPTGQSGSLIINTPNLNITDGAQVTVRNVGSGDSGILQVMGDRVVIERGSGLTASTQSGLGGNLELDLDSLLFLSENSRVSSEAQGSGDGGNIDIVAAVILGIGNSDIVAAANTGNGGNINIVTQGILGLEFRDQLTPENDITASSELGVSGTVEIINFEIEPESGLVELPTGLVDSSDQITQGCVSGGSRFVATGRGGIPVNPTGIISRDHTWTDTRDLSSFLNNPPVEVSAAVEDESLKEAAVWYTNDAGHVELAAVDATASSRANATCAISASKL
ncbi:MAG: filamentous hemagglutinin N-terminal domain-containing protein [Cyanobacteria bacterium P01_C01_bin.118]